MGVAKAHQVGILGISSFSLGFKVYAIASVVIVFLDVQRSLDIYFVFQFYIHLIFQCVCYYASVDVYVRRFRSVVVNLQKFLLFLGARD